MVEPSIWKMYNTIQYHQYRIHWSWNYHPARHMETMSIWCTACQSKEQALNKDIAWTCSDYRGHILKEPRNTWLGCEMPMPMTSHDTGQWGDGVHHIMSWSLLHAMLHVAPSSQWSSDVDGHDFQIVQSPKNHRNGQAQTRRCQL